MTGEIIEAAPAAPAGGSLDATVPARRRPHFASLEGLRAMAATLVVLTHTASAAGSASSGFFAEPAKLMDIGVAIFFALSGFLIYRPYVSAHLDGAPPMRARAFWWRRLLRIVPAYWLVLTFFWAIGNFSLGPEWWRYYLFLQIYNPFTALGGVVQAWSICTEMTFYLLVPLWSILIVRVFSRGRTRFGVELGGAIVLFIAGYVSRYLFGHSNRVWATAANGQPVYMRAVSFTWLPNQIDLFAMGMIVAIVHAWCHQQGRPERFDHILGRAPAAWWAAATAVFLFTVYTIGDTIISVGYQGHVWQERQFLYGLVAVLLLLPLAFGPQHVGGLRKVLQWKPIWWVGTVSYGLYMWHLDWINRALPKPGPNGWSGWLSHLNGRWAFLAQGHWKFFTIFAIGMGLGLLSAAISWYAMEKPLLKLKTVIPRLSKRQQRIEKQRIEQERRAAEQPAPGLASATD